MTGKEVEPVKSTVPTPPTATSTSSRKKLKSTPIDLSCDLVEEKAGRSKVVDVVNSCGFTFEWRDVEADVNKVTAIINLPTGVDPQKVDIKLPAEAGSNLSANVLQLKFEYVFSLKYCCTYLITFIYTGGQKLYWILKLCMERRLLKQKTFSMGTNLLRTKMQ